MAHCTFGVEVLTPLVIAGADDRRLDLQIEGFRPSSLRGVMRWWFRVAMGSLVPSCTELKEVEGRVFGTTAYCSPVRVRTYCVGEAHLERAYLCMNDRSGSTRKGVQREKIQRLSIVPPSKFLLRLEFPERLAPAVLGSLWLLNMCGGVGARSRRGFGSLAFTPEDEQTKRKVQELGLDFFYPEKSLMEIKSALEAQLKKVRGYLSRYVPSIGSSSSASFPVLSRTRAKLWLIKPKEGFWRSWEDAMNDLREDVYRGYKESKTPPLQEIGSANPRLASPLLIQIKRVASNKYLGVLLAFDEASTPSGYRRYLGANLGDFINFLNKMRTKYEYAEVSLP